MIYRPTREFIELEDIQKLLHKVIDSDFYIYFSNRYKPYTCSTIKDKGDVLKDICDDFIYWGKEHKYIILKDSKTENSYYAMENIIEDVPVWDPNDDE